MNFKDYLNENGIYEEEDQLLINFLTKNNVDVNQLDEGVLDFMRSFKKTAMGAVLLMMLAKGAFANQLTPDLIDSLSSKFATTAMQEIKKGANGAQALAPLDKFMEIKVAAGDIDREDVDDLMDQTLEKTKSMMKNITIDVKDSPKEKFTSSSGSDMDREAGTQEYKVKAYSYNAAESILKNKMRAANVDPGSMEIEVKQGMNDNGKVIYTAIAVPK
tara:strand:- start:448 stop:1098 length:651 start_codon:yes stop_codon:yes gene_type:complete